MFTMEFLHSLPNLSLRNSIQNRLFNDVMDYINTKSNATDKQKETMNHFFTHVQEKLSMNRGFYHALPYIPRDGKLPAVMFKMMQSVLHPHEDRLLSPRECLHLMGHPFDYELQGKILREYPKIGQNVPVRTAYWIVSEAFTRR